MLKSEEDSLCLPFCGKNLYLDRPDEKPGYDAFEAMVSETLLKTFNKYIIRRVDGKKYVQLGVDTKDTTVTEAVLENQDTDGEDEASNKSFSDAEEEKKIEQNDQRNVGENLQSKLQQNDLVFTEYFPSGVSYLEIIQNHLEDSSEKLDLKIQANQDQNSPPSLCQKIMSKDISQNSAEQQKKEIEDLTKELMLTSELIAKPIEAPCFGIPNIPLRKSRKTPQNKNTSQQQQLKPHQPMAKKGKQKKGSRKCKKQSTTTRTNKGMNKAAAMDKLALIKDDLIEDDETLGGETEEQKNSPESNLPPSSNKPDAPSNLDDLFAELLGLKNQCINSTAEEASIDSITAFDSKNFVDNFFASNQKWGVYEKSNNDNDDHESEVDVDEEDAEKDDDLNKTLEAFKSTCLPDAFDLWKEKYRSLVIEEYPEASRREVENRLMEIWCKLPGNHQKRYFEKAEQLVQRYNASASLSYMKRYKNASHPMKVSNASYQLHHPKAIRADTASSGSLEKVNVNSSADTPLNEDADTLDGGFGVVGDTTLLDEFILADCFDYKKAVKETATYNSPMDKELKKKLNDSIKDDNNNNSLHETTNINLDDDYSFSTGILVDVMIAKNDKEEEKALMQDLPQLKPSFWSPPGAVDADDTGDLTTLDVSALDDFLTGADGGGGSSSFLDEPALTSSPKPKAKRKPQRRRTTATTTTSRRKKGADKDKSIVTTTT